MLSRGWRRVFAFLLCLLASALPACGSAPPDPAAGGDLPDLNLRSAAFEHEAAIPATYTCDGDDIAPPLRWDDPPAGTQSFALIVDDPDAPVGTWDHWIVYDLPAETRELPEGGALPQGSLQGRNGWRRNDYGGPCPPSGTHRYVFKLYALDTGLGLSAGASKDDVLGAMQGHVLAQGLLVGTYQR